MSQGVVDGLEVIQVDEQDADADGELERLRMLRALEQTRWNRSAAARKLGMTLRQLRYRLQKWGME